MPEDLLRVYSQEIKFLREQGNRFGKLYPGTASQLELVDGDSSDPWVQRLIQSVAFLNARTRLRLDDGYPEIVRSYLDQIYPHYQRPFPSAAIIQFELDPQTATAEGPSVVLRGSKLRPNAVAAPQLSRCEFRTVYETQLWPVAIESLKLRGLPIERPADYPVSGSPVGWLQMRLKGLSSDVPLSSMTNLKLRFYIDIGSGLDNLDFELHRLLLDDVAAISVKCGDGPTAPVWISPEDCIQAVGFDPENEGMLDVIQPLPQTFIGYRLLTELSMFPRKFLFIDLDLAKAFTGQWPATASDVLEVNFFLDRLAENDLQRRVDAKSLKLGCTPIINLFKKTLESVHYDHRETEYPLIVSARPEEGPFEIFSVDEVRDKLVYRPYFDLQFISNNDDPNKHNPHWLCSRTPSLEASEPSSIRLTFIGQQYNPPRQETTIVHVDATCTNFNVPLSLNAESPDLLRLDEPGGVIGCTRLSPFSASYSHASKDRECWQLVSHLRLNYLSLQDTKTLQELLHLYGKRNDDSWKKLVSCITKLECLPDVGRLPRDGMAGTICRGTRVVLHIDEKKYHYLFVLVLREFFSLWCNINTFVRCRVVSKADPNKDLHRWPARAGQQPIL
jgi:type VI secretion system protein ImpG